MKVQKISAILLSLTMVTAAVYPENTVYAEAEDTSANTKYFFDVPCDGTCVEQPELIIVSDEEMELINETAAVNRSLIEESLKNVPAQVTEHSSYGSDYFYNQMTDAEKDLYDRMYESCVKFCNSTADLKRVNSEYVLDSVSCEGFSIDDAYNVELALYWSNPQFYFLSGGVVGGNGSLALIIPSSFAKYSTRKKYNDKIQSITDEWMTDINSCETEIEKERCIYKKLCDHITYKKTGFHQTIAGALADGKCVCNGYAMAFIYLCNAAGIDCVFVLSKDSVHAFNRVKIDGQWYETDVTWMDQRYSNADITFIDGDWCNKSHATFLKNDSSRDHVVDKIHDLDMFKLNDCNNDYPECSPHEDMITVEPTCQSGGRTAGYCKYCYWGMENSSGWKGVGDELPTSDHSYITKFDEDNHWLECEFGCGTKKDTEKHTVSTEYKYDDDSHWRVCTKEGCGKEFGKTVHFLDEDGVCSVCGYGKSTAGTPIDKEHFPDDIFRNYILNEMDTDGNGLLYGGETGAWNLDFSNMGIESLKGIEYISVRYLNCSGNKLKELDLSKNPDLWSLYCQKNELTKLDVTGCTWLEDINCSDNRLSELDLSTNDVLDMLYCSDNRLLRIDIGSTVLADLRCERNRLTSLDLSIAPNAELECYGNRYDITANVPLNKFTFDLKELEQYGFDPDKASEWEGAEYDPQNNILKNFTGDTVTYKYDCGVYPKEKFTLKIISAAAAGDVNNDGFVNNADLLQVRLEASALKNDPACDINGDGYVNNGDIMELRLILSKLGN